MSEEEEKIKLGDAAVRASQWETAQRFFEEALALAQKNQNVRTQARALYSLGGLFLTLRQYPKAQGYAQQALALFQQAKDRTGEGNALNDLGSLARFLGKPDEALAFFDRALTIRRELGDRLREADTLTNIGNVYGATGEYTKSREHYEQALPLHQASGNKRSEANTISSIGNLYRLTGQFLSARQQYEKALTIRQQLKDPASEASALYNIGVCHKAIGEYIPALQLYYKALALQESLGNKAVEATTKAGIASAYAALSQPEKARALYEEVLALRRTSGDKRGEATALSNLGQVYAMQDKPEQAQEHFRKALVLYQEIRDRAGEADAWNGLGIFYNSWEKYEKAQDAYEKAQALYRQLGDARGEANALSNLGASALFLKRYPAALAFCQQALPLHQQLLNPSSEQLTWDTLGTIHLALEKPHEALTAFQRAIALVEQSRTSLGALTDAKTEMLAAGLPTYYRAIALLHQLGRDEEAFLLVQQTKGRALAEQSGQVQPEWREKLTSIERAQWGLLQEQAAQLNQQLITEGVQNEPGSKKRFEALGDRLKQVEVQRATLADQLTLRYPSLARLRPRTPVASKTLAALLPSDTALVEFALTEKPLAFVVTKNGLSVYSLPQNIPELTHQISSLQSACQSTSHETNKPAQALAQGLIAPLAKTLMGKKRLILCPDGILWDVPFALLFPQQILSLAHSATLWQRDKAAVLRRPTKEILVYTNPDQGSLERFTILLDRPIKTPDRPIKTPDRPIKTPDRGLLSALRTGVLSSLPGTEAEAKTISQLFPGAVVRTGSAAQETGFLSEAGSFRRLHLASHAFLNNAASLLSCLVLASPTSGSSDDGLLTAQEILTLELSAELVVLSACSTGQGDTKRGEGVIGLSWAFLMAGAQQIVMTQWAVHDEATAQLMATFYAQVKAKKSPADALHQARRALQQSGKWRHPHYWAGFSLIGTAT